MIKNLSSTFLLAVFFSSILLSCSDEPNAVGLGVLPRNDTLKVDSTTTFGTSDTTFLLRTSGSPTRLLLGNYQYLKAKTVLQLSGFSRVPAAAVIDSATLSFNVNYRIMDSIGIHYLGFGVHKMLRSWNERTFTWDSTFVPGTFQVTPDTTFLSTVTSEDTVVKVRIDRLAREWVQAGVNAPEGIILIPDTLVTNTILGFRNDALSTAPVLTVAYHTVGDTTMAVHLIPIQSTFLANGSPPSSDTLRYIQAGISYREWLRFDSLSSAVPARAGIVSATIELATDPSAALSSSESADSVLVYFVRNNTAPSTNMALGTLCVPAHIGPQKIYRGDIRNLVQQWVTVSPNYGLVIRTFNEFTSLERIALYGSRASAPLRPKLRIVYTILP